MNPIDFEEANFTAVAPPKLETQVSPVRAYIGQAESGCLDGAKIIVTAWQPTPEEIDDIVKGEPVFLSCFGGLPPHFLTTNFHDATHPA